MKTIKSVALAAIAMSCVFSVNARADTISVVGYVNDLIYNNAHYSPDGPVSASFYGVSMGYVSGADITFSISGAGYDIRIYDDGYGRSTVSNAGLNVSTTYFTPGNNKLASLSYTALPTSNFTDVSHILQPGEDGLFTAYVRYTDFNTNTYVDGLEVSFRPFAVSLNGVATVPLPSSAPLFGLALLGLGVAGSARRKEHLTAR